ncbi:hypothetical protein QBC37DRAFT_458350 [Rhypophila decipiens]|uniref:Uncharacterized protein n=1 Tax=Rhypophila decipiens TaxID=261697 RepID=A0AAN7B195_9PEZI|nr:hypothetical protein QBC37DRAFT_458350 [Rhypophila decipiens]
MYQSKTANPHSSPTSSTYPVSSGACSASLELLELPDHVSAGEQITRGCVWAYAGTPTGIMPEVFTLITCLSLDSCPWDEARWHRDGDKRLAKGYSAVNTDYWSHYQHQNEHGDPYRWTSSPSFQNQKHQTEQARSTMQFGSSWTDSPNGHTSCHGKRQRPLNNSHTFSNDTSSAITGCRTTSRQTETSCSHPRFGKHL